MEIVPVRLKTSSYSIHIGAEILPQLGELLRPFSLSKKALLISDPLVHGLYGDQAQAALREGGFSPLVFLVPPGEKNKSLAWAKRLYDFLIKERLDRRSPLLALGGGVIGDLAGFVAATYMRGVPFVQLPSSLLAQIDSSVGGKVAVNHRLAKNMVGSFYQPLMVLIDVALLRTLPDREFRAGLAEVIKYGVITDASFFSFLEANLERLLARDGEALSLAVKRCCEIKASIVAQDEREEGLRAILNYGHTIGHALEAAGRFQIYRHGEAVSIGMEAAGRISESLGLWRPEDRARQRAILQAAGLPLSFRVKPEKLLPWIYYDKKAREGRARFVLTRAIGDAIIRELSEEGVLLRTLEEMRKDYG
ncbi:MAG: 3-dehydroquinate synthase [candidate division NC10 bacterium]|nr:3-dehydroquinate synthase [candidate division NC10 bacterium]